LDRKHFQPNPFDKFRALPTVYELVVYKANPISMCVNGLLSRGYGSEKVRDLI